MVKAYVVTSLNLNSVVMPNILVFLAQVEILKIGIAEIANKP